MLEGLPRRNELSAEASAREAVFTSSFQARALDFIPMDVIFEDYSPGFFDGESNIVNA